MDSPPTWVTLRRARSPDFPNVSANCSIGWLFRASASIHKLNLGWVELRRIKFTRVSDAEPVKHLVMLRLRGIAEYLLQILVAKHATAILG